MEKLQALLIANRGEIAVRISKTARYAGVCPSAASCRLTCTIHRELGVRTIAIYTKADSTSRHVSVADEAVLLPGEDATAYTDGLV